MTQHIGIVACSAEGAALCYRTLCLEGAQYLGAYNHPEVSLHGHALPRYMAHIDRDDLAGVGELMLSSAGKPARSPLPWLHIAAVVAQEARARGFRRIGITGTRYLTDSEVYPQQLTAAGLEYLRPLAAEKAEINRIIFEELVRGVMLASSQAYFQQVFRRMQAAGCDAVVLGCTEIPLLMNDANSPLPTLDSTRLLARAALRRAVGA